MDKFVISMATLRVLSGGIEIAAALYMLRLAQVDKALAVNSLLAFVGPTVLILTTSIGLIGLADKLSWGKIAWIFVGVSCLLIGILRK
ncbi:YqhV family protein [Paenibacillus dokdonensis]|uniref:YqhV family protein n=1 Tax=Paenibacillus dokdonensis TaxID=2567944 RepID=A0ABU6GUP1_9BACL|nr:YqhV family protein [Paenibacillus dokdonensis]MEC0243451.1 YqhV family protein [Paenibacillus dokdonensis]